MSGQLIAAFQGQGATISSFLTQTAALTNTLADRDQLIGQVIDNLNTVLGSLGDQSDQFAKAVDSLPHLVRRAGRPQDRTSATRWPTPTPPPASIADLLAQARPPLKKFVAETDRASGILSWPTTTTSTTCSTLCPTHTRRSAGRACTATTSPSTSATCVLKLNGKGRPTGVRQGGRSGHREVHAEMKSFSERNPVVIGAGRSWL